MHIFAVRIPVADATESVNIEILHFIPFTVAVLLMLKVLKCLTLVGKFFMLKFPVNFVNFLVSFKGA